MAGSNDLGRRGRPGAVAGRKREIPPGEGVLRGRDAAWRQVERLLADAARGQGGVLVIEGAAGIGKTRLLTEARSRAAGRGFAIAAGAADELSRLLPLGPFLSALGEPMAVLRGGLEGERTDSRLWLIERLRARLEELAAAGPVLVTLDDLQWADTVTVLALRLLPVELMSYGLAWLLARLPGREITRSPGWPRPCGGPEPRAWSWHLSTPARLPHWSATSWARLRIPACWNRWAGPTAIRSSSWNWSQHSRARRRWR